MRALASKGQVLVLPTGNNKPITNLQHRPVLPSGCFFAGPHADPPAVLSGPKVYGRNNVATAAAVITGRATLPPGARTSAAVQSKINIILPVGYAISYLEPVGTNLPNLIAPAFFLKLFGMSYLAFHLFLLSMVSVLENG